MADATVIGTGAQTLTALLVCGVMGLLGQGVRAVVGLKNAGTLKSIAPNQASEFDASYLLLSLMIGFIAGILAGLATGLNDFTTAVTLQRLLGVAAAGYVGADFVENSMSLVLPRGPASPRPAPPTIVPAPPPPSSAPSVPSPGGAPDEALASALRAVAPGCGAAKWAPALTAAFGKYGLDTDRRKAAALGQFLVEAGPDLSETSEDLYYTHVEAVMAAFGPHFRDAAEAEGYLRNPEKLANRVYANRLGNGDEASGDGWRYRGRGLIQITGKDAYAAFAATIGQSVEAAAAYCETAEGAAMSGCWYLASHRCLPYADCWDIAEITRLVNGPRMLGYAHRLAFSDAMLRRLQGHA